MFTQIEASSTVTKVEVGDLKNLNKALLRVADTKSKLCVPKLDGETAKRRIQLFTDAAWHNLSQVGSTGGRVVFISDGRLIHSALGFTQTPPSLSLQSSSRNPGDE